MQRVWPQSLIQELRSHMAQGHKSQNMRKHSRSNIVTKPIKRAWILLSYTSQGQSLTWVSVGSTQAASSAIIPLGTFRGESVSLSSQTARVTCIPCLGPPTPNPKLATLHLSNSSSLITTTSHSWERLSDLKDAVIRQAPLANLGCSPKPKGHNLTPPAKFLLPYKVTYSQVLGTRTWAFLGHFPYSATAVVSYCGIHLCTSIFAGLSGYLNIKRKFWTISRLIQLSQMILKWFGNWNGKDNGHHSWCGFLSFSC